MFNVFDIRETLNKYACPCYNKINQNKILPLGKENNLNLCVIVAAFKELKK